VYGPQWCLRLARRAICSYTLFPAFLQAPPSYCNLSAFRDFFIQPIAELQLQLLILEVLAIKTLSLGAQ
jgi:hypothetical protein